MSIPERIMFTTFVVIGAVVFYRAFTGRWKG